MFKDKRIKYLVIVLFIGAAVYSLFGSKKDYAEELAEKRAEYKGNLLGMESSPIINTPDFTDFKYYDADKDWVIEAEYIDEPDEGTFPLYMTDSTVENLQKAGKAVFEKDGKSFTLVLFDEKDTWLLPFYDLTNGKETYGGGRYINVEKTANNRIEIDFNKAHNFYCAYNESFICPIPPLSNKMDIEVRAGEKKLKH